MDDRQPMTPAEFDAACRELIRQCSWLSETSGRRSEARNSSVGGNPNSKHLLGMAQDFIAPSENGLTQASLVGRKLGLWVKVHDVTSGMHLHTQGLQKGPPEDTWMEKYGG